MDKKSQDFSPEQVRALAQNPAAQQLITLLQQSDSEQMKQIMAAANAGDYANAMQALNKLLTPQMKKLAQELRK